MPTPLIVLRVAQVTVLTGVSSNVVLCPLTVTRYRTLNIYMDTKFGPYYRADIYNTVFPTGGSVYSWNHKIA